jgi:hypothetical protein
VNVVTGNRIIIQKKRYGKTKNEIAIKENLTKDGKV